MRGPKKSDTIEVRLPFETKRAFSERCRAEGRTVSEAVRAFVDGELNDAAPRRKWAIVQRLRTATAFASGAALALTVAFGPASVASTADLRPQFRALDKDGDGVVSQAEYGGGSAPGLSCGKHFVLAIPLQRASMPEVRGIRPFALSDRDFRFGDVDADHDKRITLAEYEAHQLRTLRAGFDHWDRNHDGVLSRAEHGAAYRTIFVGDPPAFAPFSELDRNRDGKVAWDEFLA